MQRIADYKGKLLNHVESLYRPGERKIASKIVEALGCAVSDTGFTCDGEETFLAVHPNPDDRNMQNNAFYMSPMRPEQLAMETHLKRLSEEDVELHDRLATYRKTARPCLWASRISRFDILTEAPCSRWPITWKGR